MTFFPDLMPYTYSRDTVEDGVFNIGWLGEGNRVPTGDVPAKFVSALELLCARPVMLDRGVHVCEFCSNTSNSGQIRVCHSNGKWYSAPTMVHHYVTAHHYLPPREFIDAVLNGIAVAIEPERIQYWPR